MKYCVGVASLAILGLAQLSFAQPPPLMITTPSPLPSANVNQFYAATINSNGSSSTMWSHSGSLPPGLSLGATGGSTSISGTPQQGGTFSFTIVGFDPQSESTARANFSITVSSFVFLTGSPLPGGIVGQSYDVPLQFSGGTPPYLFSITPGQSTSYTNGFPPGLSISTNPSVDGDPTVPGTYDFILTATDYLSHTTSSEFLLTVAAPVAISTAPTLAAATVGLPYTAVTLTATGGFPPYTFFVNGTPPPGLSLSAAGVLSGTPTTGGTYTFTVEVTDTQNYAATKQFSVTFNTATPLLQVTPASLTFSGLNGGDSPPSQNVLITAVGSTAVNYAVSVDAGTKGSTQPSWITVTPLSGSTPGSLKVSVNPGIMPTATYNAAIHITVPSNSAQAAITVPVTFNVMTANPQLTVLPASLNFGARVQTPGVQTQTLVLRNSGGGGPLTFGATVVGKSTWISNVAPATGATAPNTPVFVQVTINSQGLAIGNYHDIVRLTWSGGTIDVPVTLFVASAGSILSLGQSGLLFESRQGNGNGQTQIVSVLNLGDPSTTVNFSASVVKGMGDDWAMLTNANGSATGASPGAFSVSAGGDSTTLGVGGHYALIQVVDLNAPNSVKYVTAVLEVEPATDPPEPHPYPAGLFFTSGNPSQNISVFTSSTTSANFQASASTDDGANWLTVSPTSGITSTQTPAPVSVSVSAGGLANGLYTGNVNVSENGFLRSVNVTFLVTGQSSSPVAPPGLVEKNEASPRAAACTPTRVTMAQTALANNFSVPAGWPASLIAVVNDNCGNPIMNGSVVASFSNGDPPLTLAGNQSNNVYTATWQPGTVIPSMTMTMNAASGSLTPAMQQFAGAVQQNTSAAPTLAAGGTLHIEFTVAQANALGNGLAPGNVAQVYGTGLASTASSPGVVPLDTNFNGTFMLINGIEAPLYFVSPNQLDVQVPFELAPNKQYTAIVSANGALTLPETINVVPQQPGMAANVDGSVIAQHAADFSLVTAAHPAAPGEPLIIYLAGMGATDPAVASGAATPLALVPATVQPTVMVDNQQASIGYAGLTPGGVGLYQINFTVPANARTGSLSLVVMQNGQASNTATLPVN